MPIRNLFRHLGKSLLAALPDPAKYQGCIAAYCVGLILGYAVQILLKPYPGFPLGGPADFTACYTAAHIIRAGRGDRLYDLALQANVQQSFLRPHGWIMENGLLPYYYPPFGALLYLPFSFLPLQWAFHAWNALNIGLGLACVRLLAPPGMKLHDTKAFLTMSLAVFSFYPVFRVFWNGQSTLLIALCMVLSYTWLRRNKEGLAGVGLALGLLKPQLVITLLLVMMYRRRWRFVFGFATGAAMLAVVSAIMVGSNGLASYVALMQSASSPHGFAGIVPAFMVSIRGTVARLTQLFSLHFGASLTAAEEGVFTAILCLPVLALLLSIWRGNWDTSSDRFQIQYALTIVASLLLSYHLYDYDLSLLMIPGFLVAGYFSSRGELRTGLLLVCAAHVGPFLPWFFFDKPGWAQTLQVLILALAMPLIRHARPAGSLSEGKGVTPCQSSV